MAARGLADYTERKHSPFMKPGPPDGTAFTLPATGIEAPALDTRERLRQISPKAGVEVEDGVDSATQVHADEREHGSRCRVSIASVLRIEAGTASWGAACIYIVVNKVGAFIPLSSDTASLLPVA
jgi:hypothetical protein